MWWRRVSIRPGVCGQWQFGGGDGWEEETEGKGKYEEKIWGWEWEMLRTFVDMDMAVREERDKQVGIYVPSQPGANIGNCVKRISHTMCAHCGFAIGVYSFCWLFGLKGWRRRRHPQFETWPSLGYYSGAGSGGKLTGASADLESRAR